MWESIAREMLGLGEYDILPYSLSDKMQDVNDLMRKCNSEIASRQIVALAIVLWANEKLPKVD